MDWGYGGVFPGEFVLIKDDRTMNALRFAAENGFKYASVGSGALEDPEKRRQIIEYADAHELDITIHPHIRYLERDAGEVQREIDAFLELLREVKPQLRTPICHMGVGPYHRFMAKPTLAEQFDQLAERLPALSIGCKELGAPLGIENHGDYYCSDLVELCRRVKELGIFLDTGNCFLIGEKPVPACREAAPYTIGTHFKDHLVQPAPRTLTFEIQGAVLGEGHVGLREIYLDLARLNPAPEKIIHLWELVPPREPRVEPWEALRRSWEFCRSLPDPAEVKGGAA